MPHSINEKGLRAIIKHNVMKQMKNPTKQQIVEIEKRIHNLSLEELRTKGITRNIIDGKKPRRKPKKQLGGMKRSREEEDEPPRRNFIRKVAGIASGEKFNQEEFDIQHREKKDKRTYR